MTPLVEIGSARCVECDQHLDAAEFTSGEAQKWPVVAEGVIVGQPRSHRVCGGRVELNDVRPTWHFCDDNCECGLGGIPERVN